MSNKNEKLFSEFPGISTEAWKEKIVTDLKGADFEKRLVWKTNEGFNVNPFYRAEDIEGLEITKSLPGEFPYVRGTKKDDNTWYVRQDITVTDFKAANKKALDILGKGVDSLGFKIKGKDVNKENIATLLDEIHLPAIELNFISCAKESVNLITILTDYLKEKKYDLASIKGSVNTDFIKPILTKGKVKEEWVNLLVEAVKAAKELPCFKVVAVNAYLFNDAGSFIAQELAYGLAWGNEILSRLVEAGIDAQEAASKIKFNFGISSNYFMEIAKFRAARWLWAEIVNAYVAEWNKDCPVNKGENCRCAAKMNILAKTSSFNLTVFDAYVNLLRTQTEAMSASIAGVDSMLVSPFDETYTIPDDFSERIARNQQLLLKEECHFDKVVDPSGGSYYIESLTESIAQEAWKQFLAIEEKGFYEMVKSGEIQEAVNASANKRFIALANRKEILLGTNQFPNFTEEAGNKIKNSEHTCLCGCNEKENNGITTLNTHRLGEQFEELRLITEKSGKQPKAFMLTIGNLAMRLARAQFSCNFLACAGYKVIDNLGFETIEAGVEAARKAGAEIIVLCSSDDEYTTYAPQAYESTKGKETLIVAGAPANMDELKSLGIEYFINVRSNVLETLKSLNAKLGI